MADLMPPMQGQGRFGSDPRERTIVIFPPICPIVLLLSLPGRFRLGGSLRLYPPFHQTICSICLKGFVIPQSSIVLYITDAGDTLLISNARNHPNLNLVSTVIPSAVLKHILEHFTLDPAIICPSLFMKSANHLSSYQSQPEHDSRADCDQGGDHAKEANT